MGARCAAQIVHFAVPRKDEGINIAIARAAIHGRRRLLAQPQDARQACLRILLLAPQPFFSERGTPIAVRLLAETLGQLGHRVDILTYPMGASVSAKGVSIHRCRAVPGVKHVGIGFSWAKVATDASLCLSLFSMARPGRYDVVHAVEESIYPALALRRRHGAQVVYDMDSSLAAQLGRTARPLPLGSVFRTLERWAVTRADAVVTMCEEMAERVRLLRPADSVHVLHDVPVQPEDPQPARDDLSKLVGPDRRSVLYVGNLEAYQGIDLLLETIQRVGPEVPVGLVIVGGEPKRVGRYRQLAQDMGIAERVTFLGRRPVAQLPALLSQADILVSPRVDGTNTPLKIYSYMKSGRPILATRLPTHTQVLDDGTAVLAHPDPADMARGLERLVSDPFLRARLGEAAAERVSRRYSRARFREAVVETYGRLLGPPEGTVRQPVEAFAGD